ncbi:hypothetical protein METHB2_70094 [Candidatus Methylobacter favarea]|uniref:Uncharacterized protein n=1 Tax=Candidatus Methylobacter favarea TaxID=2707345 RepID=A0A8S0YAS5_9GAMM|nr:hypothetical protein METHB2_70094 [Candidatus Methylobacter favarea]
MACWAPPLVRGDLSGAGASGFGFLALISIHDYGGPVLSEQARLLFQIEILSTEGKSSKGSCV